MEHETLLIVQGTLGIALGTLFLWTGIINSRRPITGKEFLPLFIYSLWWYSAAAVMIKVGGLELLSVLWRPDFALYVTLEQSVIVFVCVALFCLTHYFLYLIIGPNRLWTLLGVFYAVSALGLVYLVNFQQPVGLHVHAGRVELIYAQEIPAFALSQRLTALLIVPPLMGLAGYMALIRRSSTKLQKYRILFTSATVLIMIAAFIIIPLIDPPFLSYAILTYRSLAGIAIGSVLLTHHPPARIKHRLERVDYGWS